MKFTENCLWVLGALLFEALCTIIAGYLGFEMNAQGFFLIGTFFIIILWITFYISRHNEITNIGIKKLTLLYEIQNKSIVEMMENQPKEKIWELLKQFSGFVSDEIIPKINTKKENPLSNEEKNRLTIYISKMKLGEKLNIQEAKDFKKLAEEYLIDIKISKPNYTVDALLLAALAGLVLILLTSSNK
ncbi:MAG: hypothetical protein A2Y62_08015 [Candidatus Fischerbacteria bacterium RBG_13_37_8]|uniref:Uncharacterized protein n=1 Tax=Candidatus Fischerbacteria bacterium RBG_13_37_8 TaxID=1817863 RepID=A0A1F5V5C0_9BACT|nr:MAG: hypothetical protein A2Y62_08015 [Candidatus Fischerbacteria bacterium RBG_13_37_8]